MTPNQYLWAQARDRLVAAVTGIGFSAELAELMAKQRKRSIKRTSQDTCTK